MKILYGVVGEGMGHATRSKVVAEHLIARGHKVKIVVSGRAYEFLRRHFEDVVPIRGLTIRYEKGAMNRQRSFLTNMILAPAMLLENASRYLEDVRHYEPELVISDFDSYAYFFAKRFRLPIISIDNQQIIHKCKHDETIFRDVEPDYRATRAFVKAKLPGCNHYLITSFFAPAVRKKFAHKVTIVPPILRREILEATPSRGSHVLVYQTSTSDERLIAELRKLSRFSFVVYGLRRDAVEGNCIIKSFREAEFVKDLASARAVVTNGGLSLIHEAIYLKKPIFSVPVRHQFEQEMNARYLERCGYGVASPETEASGLAAFLREETRFTDALAEYRQHGNRVLEKKVDHLIAGLA